MNTNAGENKQLISSYLSALSGRRKTPQAVARFVSDEKLQRHIEEVEAAFPGYELIAEETLAERDLVVVRGVFRGVHGGVFAGIEPTGKTVSASLMIIYRIADGRIAEHWLQFDISSVLEQLKLAASVSV